MDSLVPDNARQIAPRPSFNVTNPNTTDIAVFEESDGSSLMMIEQRVTYNFRLRDTKIWSDELAKHGLLEEWVTLGTYTFERQAGMRPPVTRVYTFTDWPVKNESMVVTNPKDIVTKALPDLQSLRDDMAATLLELISSIWTGGEAMDAAQAYAPAIFMLQSATDSMAQAKKTAEEAERAAEEEERKRKQNLIMLIVSVVLMVRFPYNSLCYRGNRLLTYRFPVRSHHRHQGRCRDGSGYTCTHHCHYWRAGESWASDV